jgi:hypothetical protein
LQAGATSIEKETMNFISHYFLDKEQDDSFFFVGISTPDLLSVFDRSIRLKENRLPLLMENEAVPAEVSFYNGVLRHFEVDALFHNSAFFHDETAHISRLVRDTFPGFGFHRLFFVSHVLFELLLDKILIDQHPDLLPEYFRHFDQQPEYVTRLTQWVTRTEIPGYQNYYEKFVHRKHLYLYSDWKYVIYVLKRILQRVRVAKFSYLDDPRFLAVIRGYEAELTTRCPLAFSDFTQRLERV